MPNTDRLLIFHKEPEYSQGDDTASSFDVSLYGEMLSADVGYAITPDGVPLSESRLDELSEYVLEPSWQSVASGYHERFVVTDPEKMADEVRLRTGERVDIGSYDTVLIGQVIFHTVFGHVLTDRHSDVTVIGIQDESLQDIMCFSPQLQMHHLSSLRSYDGFIASEEVYYRWVREFTDAAEYVPLLIPEAHFDGMQESTERSGIICLGSATHNTLPSNFYTSIAAFRQLREQGHDIQGEIIGVMDWQEDRLASYAEQTEGLTVRPFMDEEFYDYLSKYDFALIPTARISTGRISAELAAAGVPCIGNEGNEYQSRCFPDLCVHPFDTGRITTLGHRLLTDSGFYQRVRRKGLLTASSLTSHGTYREKLEVFVEAVEAG